MRVRVLGPLEICSDGDWRWPGTAKQRSVLAALVVAGGKTVSVDQLTETVWSENVPPTAVNLIQGHVGYLRRALGDSFGEILRTRSPGYQLILSSGELDSSLFELMVKEGTAAWHGGDHENASKTLAEALGLWRGPAFADVPMSPEVKLQAARLEQLRLTALETHVDADLELGLHNALIPELQQLVESHQLYEPFWGQLMRALYCSGRRAEAMVTYERLRDVLDSELGVEPMKAVQALREEILADGTVTDTTPYARRKVIEVPRQLPSDIGGFTGRADILTLLDDVVTHDDQGFDPRPLTIIVVAGQAGVGKTTLAVHWAHKNAQRFPDGQLYVDLCGFAGKPPLDAYDAMRDVLQSVDVRQEQISTTPAARLSQYRTVLSNRRMLVVLDDACTVDQVRPLLAGGPGSVVIVTSRNQLSGLVALEGAQIVTIDPFSPEEATLFLRRRIGRPRSDGEAKAVEQLVGHSDGLPLALATVAAQCAVSTTFVTNLAKQLGQGGGRKLDAFVSSDASVDMRATFSGSYRVLGEDAAHLFRLLGQHPNRDVSLRTAARLAGLPHHHVRRLLAELCCVHLLREYAPGRYVMPGLLHVYAAELGTGSPLHGPRRHAVERTYDWRG